jgi:hypothetical protein
VSRCSTEFARALMLRMSVGFQTRAAGGKKEGQEGGKKGVTGEGWGEN